MTTEEGVARGYVPSDAMRVEYHEAPGELQYDASYTTATLLDYEPNAPTSSGSKYPYVQGSSGCIIDTRDHLALSM